MTLAAAHNLWQFWFAATMTLVSSTTNGAMTYALVTDRLAPVKLSRALALLNAAGAMAGILSFSMTWFAMERLGQNRSLLIASVLPVLAAVLLKLFHSQGQEGLPTLVRVNIWHFLSPKRRISSTPVSHRAVAERC